MIYNNETKNIALIFLLVVDEGNQQVDAMMNEEMKIKRDNENDSEKKHQTTDLIK